MPRVVPSQIIVVIDAHFQDQGGGVIPIDRPAVRGLLTLIDRVPEDLLQVNPTTVADFIIAVEVLRNCAEERGQGHNASPQEVSAIRKVREVLATCPDDVAPPGTTDPAFITDMALRADLHRDVGEANQALHNREWKGATVLAGSIVEALLLWALQNRKKPEDIQAAAASLGKKLDLRTNPLEKWYLPDLIEYAAATKLISDDTKAAAILAKDFRNYIHPGKAIRLGRKCQSINGFGQPGGSGSRGLRPGDIVLRHGWQTWT